MLFLVIILFMLSLLLWICSIVEAYNKNLNCITMSILAFLVTQFLVVILYFNKNGWSVDINSLEQNGVYEVVCQGKTDHKNYALLKYLGDGSVRSYNLDEPLNGKVFKAVKEGKTYKLAPYSPSE